VRVSTGEVLCRTVMLDRMTFRAIAYLNPGYHGHGFNKAMASSAPRRRTLSTDVACERKNGDGEGASKILLRKLKRSDDIAVTGAIAPPTPIGS